MSKISKKSYQLELLLEDDQNPILLESDQNALTDFKGDQKVVLEGDQHEALLDAEELVTVSDDDVVKSHDYHDPSPPQHDSESVNSNVQQKRYSYIIIAS